MKLSVAAYAVPPSQRAKFSYEPTILSSAILLRRLSIEISFLLTRLKSSWPECKQDPLGFARGAAAELLQARTADHRGLATALAMFLVGGAVLLVLMTDGTKRANHLVLNNADDSTVQMLELAPATAPAPTDTGVGAGSLGRVGFDSGRGEGSHPEPKRAQGGGSGGNRQKLTVSDGSIPQPSHIPAPIPTTPIKKNPVLPAAGIDIDAALWRQITRLSMAIPDLPRRRRPMDQEKAEESEPTVDKELVTEAETGSAWDRTGTSVGINEDRVAESAVADLGTIPTDRRRSSAYRWWPSVHACCRNQNRSTPKKRDDIRLAALWCCARCFQRLAR